MKGERDFHLGEYRKSFFAHLPEFSNLIVTMLLLFPNFPWEEIIPNNSYFDQVLSSELEQQHYPDPHQIFHQALSDYEYLITAVYGTPVGGSDLRGWGSVNNGINSPNYVPTENFYDGARYLRRQVPGKKYSQHADVVLVYGLNESGKLNIVGSSVEFAKEILTMKPPADFEGTPNTISFNLRPPAGFSVDDLYNLVDSIWTGQATYADGTVIVSPEFMAETGIPLSLDLEVMLESYPNGIPATALNRVTQRYREIMESYGYSDPVWLLYERGLGVADMVDDVNQLDKDGIVVVYSGFVENGDLPYKLKAGKSIISSVYQQTRGGCMSYINWSLPEVARDNYSKKDDATFLQQPYCALAILQ